MGQGAVASREPGPWHHVSLGVTLVVQQACWREASHEVEVHPEAEVIGLHHIAQPLHLTRRA